MTKKPLKRKRTDRPYDEASETDLFFDEYMNRIEEQMADFFGDIMENSGQVKGFVYGFNMTSVAGGDVAIDESGNIQEEAEEEPGKNAVPIIEKTGLPENEPLTDVIDGDKEVRVLAELPGVEKEDIKINVKPGTVSLKVDTETRKYRKDIALPCRVLTENIKTTHKNGILEIIIRKAI